KTQSETKVRKRNNLKKKKNKLINIYKIKELEKVGKVKREYLSGKGQAQEISKSDGCISQKLKSSNESEANSAIY
ncbi:4397_t:CDS:1, partial [Racocetra fulgida]